MLKVLEAGVLIISMAPIKMGIPYYLFWSVPELDTFNKKLRLIRFNLGCI